MLSVYSVYIYMNCLYVQKNKLANSCAIANLFSNRFSLTSQQWRKRIISANVLLSTCSFQKCFDSQYSSKPYGVMDKWWLTLRVLCDQLSGSWSGSCQALMLFRSLCFYTRFSPSSASATMFTVSCSANHYSLPKVGLFLCYCSSTENTLWYGSVKDVLFILLSLPCICSDNWPELYDFVWSTPLFYVL